MLKTKKKSKMAAIKKGSLAHEPSLLQRGAAAGLSDSTEGINEECDKNEIIFHEQIFFVLYFKC